MTMSGRKRISTLTWAVCALAVLSWVFLPVSLVLSIWSGDWRWLLTGFVLALTGFAFAWLAIGAEKTSTKRSDA